MSSIFEIDTSTTEEKTTSTDNRDKVTKAAERFHKAPEGSEPDWAGMLLNAKNQTEKFKIRAARDAWIEEQRFQKLQQAQEAHKQHIASVLQTPHRNKVFWDNLKVNDPKVYYSVEAQRQMKTDKATMGLRFHLKGK